MHSGRSLVSVTIVTLNEEKNVERAIRSAYWADEVLVVDCGSSDKTVEIASQLGAKVVRRAWEGFGQQKNFAQNEAKHDWVLNIDADEEVSEELKSEILSVLKAHALNTESVKQGYFVPRLAFYMGRWIYHGGWFPNQLIRFANRKSSIWTEPHLHEEWTVRGGVGRLRGKLFHYPFSSVEDQIKKNILYAKQGSLDLLDRGVSSTWAKLIFKPIGKFFETYFLKRGFLDGLPGFIISMNAAYSMFMKFTFLIEKQRALK